MDKDLDQRLQRLETELNEIKRTIYGHDTTVGLLGQLYDLKKQLQAQNKLIYFLITLVASEFVILVDILTRLGV